MEEFRLSETFYQVYFKTTQNKIYKFLFLTIKSIHNYKSQPNRSITKSSIKLLIYNMICQVMPAANTKMPSGESPKWKLPQKQTEINLFLVPFRSERKCVDSAIIISYQVLSFTYCLHYRDIGTITGSDAVTHHFFE